MYPCDTRENPGVASTGVFYSLFYPRQGLKPQARYRLPITVQPFADEVANHTRHNGNHKG